MEDKRKIEPMNPAGLFEAVHKRNQWSVEVPANVHPGDILDPSFWAHVASKLRPRDLIEVWAPGNAWFCVVVVLDADRTYAKVQHVVGPFDLTVAVTEAQVNQAYGTALFEVIHRGPRKWSVVRRSDRQVVHENEETKAGAEKWLEENAGILKKAA